MQVDQLRGRELPGFLSSQAFYMCMSKYVEQWTEPMEEMICQVRLITQDAVGILSDILFPQYPSLRNEFRVAAARILSDLVDTTIQQLRQTIDRERDPFTLNDFLQQWVNKLRFDIFANAVDDCFDSITENSNMETIKNEVFQNMTLWYQNTHNVTALANAKDMSAILEAYWNLSAKRFIDNCCLTVDKILLGNLSSLLQEYMYKFVRDEAKLEVKSS